MCVGRPKIELLILDFAGVCTPSPAELVAADESPGDITIRADAESIVRLAHERGATVVVLSNEISSSWIPSIPLLSTVDHVIDCSDNKIYKPDRRAFQRCLLLTGATAEGTLMVDDSPDNTAVAASLGMQTILFDCSEVATSWKAVRGAFS